MVQNYNLGGDDETLRRQQALADMLRQQSMTPLPAASYRVSPLEGLAKMLQAYSARKWDEVNDQTRQANTQRNQADMSQFVKLLRGAPAVNPLTPNDDEGNPMPQVSPAQEPDLPGAMDFAMQSKSPQLQALGQQLMGNQIAQLMPKNPLEQFGKIDPKDYTSESLQKFLVSKNPADLAPRVKKEIAPSGEVVDLYNPTPNKNYGAVRDVNMGGTQLFMLPNGQPLASLNRSQSPDSVASNQVTMRGQNLTDARARQGLELQREAQRTQIMDTAAGPIAVDKGSGTARPVMMNGAPVPSESTMKRTSGANRVLALLDQAEPLVKQATNSYAGAGIDLAARIPGVATKGATAIGQLKAIQGALLNEMPRMEGPQSNYDVQNYVQAAGSLADPTTPREIKLAAISTIREIQRRYAGNPSGVSNFSQGDSSQVRKYNPATGRIE